MRAASEGQSDVIDAQDAEIGRLKKLLGEALTVVANYNHGCDISESEYIASADLMERINLELKR